MDEATGLRRKVDCRLGRELISPALGKAILPQNVDVLLKGLGQRRSPDQPRNQLQAVLLAKLESLDPILGGVKTHTGKRHPGIRPIARPRSRS